MARMIRRHWKTMLLQLLLLAAIVGFALKELARPPARAAAATVDGNSGGGAAAAAPAAIDPLTYQRVQQLRQQFALTDRDLAAASCTQAQASSVLTSLLNWVSSNAAAWDQQQQSNQSAHQALDEANRKINVGPLDTVLLSSVPGLQQAAATSDQQYTQFLQVGSVTATSQLAPSQQQIISTASTNQSLGAPDLYRYASGLTASEVTAINLAASRAGGTVPAGTAGVSASSLSEVQDTANQYMAGVSAAEAAALPVPATMQQSATPTTP